MSDLILTVLGSSPSWPNPGGACSGYLLSAAGTRILVECGPGVAGRLLARVGLEELSAIVISHMHPDHFLDLVSLRQGIRHGGLGGESPPLVLLPPGGARALAELGRALNDNERFFSDTFRLDEYDPARVSRLGATTFAFRRVPHSAPCYAMRIEAGSTLAFSGDCGPSADLVEHARAADIFLCEAALESPEPPSAPRSHLTPAEAGEIARRAGVRRLLLTHAPVDPRDPERPAREAATAFGGPIERVRDGADYS